MKTILLTTLALATCFLRGKAEDAACKDRTIMKVESGPASSTGEAECSPPEDDGGMSVLQTGMAEGKTTQQDDGGLKGLRKQQVEATEEPALPPIISKDFQWDAPVGDGPSGEGAVNGDDYLDQVLQEQPAPVHPAGSYAPAVGEEVEVTEAKVKAIEGICALHRDRDHFLELFHAKDVDGDGKLSSVTEIPAPSASGGSGVQEVLVDQHMWLNLTLPDRKSVV